MGTIVSIAILVLIVLIIGVFLLGLFGITSGYARHNEELRQADIEQAELLEENLVLPAYDFTLKCSHAFNQLDARGAISVTERTGYIGRVRRLARLCAEKYVNQREAMSYPLLKNNPALLTSAKNFIIF